MKLFKLFVHQKTYQKDVLINQKDYPSLKIGDLIEIYSPEDDYSRLVLQVTAFSDEFNRSVSKENKEYEKPSISIEQTIAQTFHLRPFGDVIVNIVNPNDVALDSVELSFKDQYLARSDMWRMKRHIIGSCLYLNKKIEFSNVRCQVFEMWSQGERMACGYINEDTKVVYRSASSMVYLFIQMSSEMWDFDINGDLYFEKAVNGFLSDLFNKWKKFSCSHDVTIVLFSRTFYDATSITQFPENMRDCLQQDYKKRFYEDFYRVAVQNERFDDWQPILVLLKELFNRYENEVVRIHERLHGGNIPRARNSTSSEGNFLEVLNMSLNVFVEKHHLDRSFDRTGQLSVVISPGVGVFEVDLDLTNITKQRIIDNGIGSDLVCLGEQPLHAVPLFKFNSNFSQTLNDFQYNMPHWINLSFYSSTKKSKYSHFVPRIKFPNDISKTDKTEKPANQIQQLIRASSRDSPNSRCRNILTMIDYDEYDAQVFKIPQRNTINNNIYRTKLSSFLNHQMEQSPKPYSLFKRRSSDDNGLASLNDLLSPSELSIKRSSDLLIPCDFNHPRYHQILSTSMDNKTDSRFSKLNYKQKPESKDDLIVRGFNTSLINSPVKPKALINPFDPSHVTIKLTSNRRRWTHVFPLGPTGIFMQQHHYQAVPQNTACTLLPSAACADTSLTYISDKKDQLETTPRKISVVQMKASELPWSNERKSTTKSLINNDTKVSVSRTSSIFGNEANKNVSIHSDKSLLWAWGATGEQEWTPAITTGVDWKSLVMPACLPVTTDFLPDKRTLQQDYVTYAYTLLPEDQSAELLQQRCYRGEDDVKNHSPLSTIQVYLELICQRLQQGFQIILFPKSDSNQQTSTPNKKRLNEDREYENREYAMSIGRIYHELKLEEPCIIITNYHPRHPYPVKKIHYCYRFRAPDNETYGISWVDFTSEKLENYSWNYLDNYICMRGDSEYELKENLKFWRFRLLMLPTMQSTRTIIEKYLSGDDKFACDLYKDFEINEKNQLQEGFLRFLDMINRIRRPGPNKKMIVKSEVQIGARRSSAGNALRIADINRDKIFQNPSFDALKQRLKAVSNDGDEVDGNIMAKSSKDQINAAVIAEELIESDKKLSSQSPINVIIESMKNSSDINYLIRQGGLPPYTFISAEAVIWAKDNFADISNESQAILFLQKMCEKGLICHASGDRNLPFKYGYYFYYIVDQNSVDHSQPDISMFEKEWMEVGIIPQCGNEDDLPIDNNNQVFTFKKMLLDLDSKNDRTEWVDIKYHSLYDPEHAFELVIEWMVATGNAISEIVQGWSRKAFNTGLHLVPIPADPFALPFSSKSDPLRGPIFIPLNIDCLPVILSKDERLFNFQERILVKFGFIPFWDPMTDNQRQFVHVSGSIFVMLPSQNPSNKKFGKRGRLVKNEDTGKASPHEEYITRHFSGVKQDGDLIHIDAKVGFIWCWNYMITKRWKTNVTGDENSMRKIMEDFRRFCRNSNDRLLNFWKSLQSSKF